MQQFQVPQYINIEDKIIGPFTLKQFLYLVGGAAFLVVAWFFLNPFLFFVVAPPLGAFAAALAFLTVKGIPFPTIVGHAATFYLKPRLYIWKRTIPKKVVLPKTGEPEGRQLKTPAMTESKLSNLAWSLDIKEKINR